MSSKDQEVYRLYQETINGNQISAGTVQMNDSYFNTSAYISNNEKQNVICQEITHTLVLIINQLMGLLKILAWIILQISA